MEKLRVSRLEQVKRAIRMTGPDYVPTLFFNGDRKQSGIILIDAARHFMGEDKQESEWGFRWQQRDETMGQPKEGTLS